MLLIISLVLLICFIFREYILCVFETPEETYKRHIRNYWCKYNKCFTVVRSHSRKNGQNVRSHTRQIRTLPFYPKKPLALIKKEKTLALESKKKLTYTPKSSTTNYIAITDEEIKPNTKLKARFFIATQVNRASPKLVVLTSDGELYSEFVVNSSLYKFVKYYTNFDSFLPCDFVFDQNVHPLTSYQPVREISMSDSLSYPLTNQQNWISSYLSKKNVTFEEQNKGSPSTKSEIPKNQNEESYYFDIIEHNLTGKLLSGDLIGRRYETERDALKAVSIFKKHYNVDPIINRKTGLLCPSVNEHDKVYIQKEKFRRNEVN